MVFYVSFRDEDYMGIAIVESSAELKEKLIPLNKDIVSVEWQPFEVEKLTQNTTNLCLVKVIYTSAFKDEKIYLTDSVSQVIEHETKDYLSICEFTSSLNLI